MGLPGDDQHRGEPGGPADRHRDGGVHQQREFVPGHLLAVQQGRHPDLAHGQAGRELADHPAVGVQRDRSDAGVGAGIGDQAELPAECRLRDVGPGGGEVAGDGLGLDVELALRRGDDGAPDQDVARHRGDQQRGCHQHQDGNREPASHPIR